MKRMFITYILLSVSIYGFSAQKTINNTYDKHYGWIALHGGFYSHSENYEDISTIGGGVISFGFGYEFRHNGFFASIGGDIELIWSNAITTTYKYDQLMYDTQGKKINYHFDIAESSEQIYATNISVPILLGYYNTGFYMGIGAKVGYCISAKGKTFRHYTTYATYPQYFEDFEQMPNHFYKTYTAKNIENIKMNIPINIIAEVGYDVLYNANYNLYGKDQILKIGLYAEYGLRNAFNNKIDAPLFSVNQEHPTQLNVYSYYNNKAITNKILPFNIGLKVTYMLQIPTKNCHCK